MRGGRERPTSGGGDVLRGYPVHLIAPAGGGDVEEEIELCPEAHAYSYTLCGGFLQTEPPSPPPDPPELVAVLKLQDSQIELWSDCCSIRADLPGVRWPGSSKLVVKDGAEATLNISYGQCGWR